MIRICPKCNYVRKDTDNCPDWQCPACQVAYHKVGAARTTTHAAAPVARTGSHGLKWLVAAVLLGGAAYLGKPLWKDVQPDVVPSASAGQPTVVLYSTSWCGYCAAAREFFDQNGIQYTELDTEKSTEGYEGHKKLGGRGVPLIVIGDDIIRGYNEQALRHQLQPWLKGV